MARHNLPIELSPFIGRAREIAEIRRLLAGGASGPGLLTLTGVGGAGKTRLALRVALTLTPDFRDGVWLVELASLADPALVARALAATVGVQEQASQPLPQTLAAALAPKQMLLVLDNCEHLVGVCAKLAETLLRLCPNVKILATSREPLRIPGEVTWPVPSLALPPPDATLSLDALAQVEAVALFVDRAQARQPAFALTPANASAVVAICRHLEGLPLALELAAAQLAALPPEQLATRLGGTLGSLLHLLGGGSRTTPRQETLRATLDWSHALLTATERVVFRRLAVFAGGFTLEAAEVVGAGEGVDPANVGGVLASLVGKSLVVALTQDAAARYRLLEPVRQYAQEQLRASGEEATIRRHHAEAYLTLAESAAPELRGGGRGPWLAQLEAEHDNLRVALGWAFTVDRTSEERTRGGRLAAALGHFWFFRGYYAEGIAWITRAIAQPAELAPAARAKALGVGGELTWMLAGPSALGRAWLAESIALWRSLEDEEGLAYALQAAATVDPESAQADEYARESLELHRARGDRPGMAWALHAAGLLALQRGAWAEAQIHLAEALALYREVGDDWFAAQALNNLGDIARIQGDDVPAAALYQESLARFRAQGALAATPSLIQNLGYLALRASRAQQALARFQESLGLFRDQGDRRGIAESLAGLAGALGALKQPERAARFFGAAEALLEASGAELWPANRPDYERSVAIVRDQLGRADFAAAWTAGRTSRLDQVIGEALSGDLIPASAVTAGTACPTAPVGPVLTPREREVARLVARGLTNRQIAAELVITPGTANLHVKNILSKLGFSSRAQIAAWVVERGLVSRPPESPA